MSRGFFLLEILIALTILGVLVVYIFPTFGFLLKRLGQSSEAQDSVLILQEGVEATYNVLMTETEWSIYSSTTPYHVTSSGGSYWVLKEGEDTLDDGYYHRSITLPYLCRMSEGLYTVANDNICPNGYSIDKNSRSINVVVSWQDKGKPQTLHASLVVTKEMIL